MQGSTSITRVLLVNYYPSSCYGADGAENISKKVNGIRLHLNFSLYSVNFRLINLRKILELIIN